MGRLAKRNLRRRSSLHLPQPASFPSLSQPDYTQINLTRGIAQQLPFRGESFDTIVATFPAEYIFDPSTLDEAQRTLKPGGRFVILPGAVITGRGLSERLMAWIYRITGETPPNLSEILHERSKEPFAKAGFHVEIHEISVKSSLVFILLATKSSR
jgi:ubiquinone/menaquinone biosynthesis C-methylase UbiE